MTELEIFAKEYKFKGKSPLAVALVVTHHARDRGLPLNPDTLLTEGGGQVLGLGKTAVQNILAKHGISRVLAAEGGRTSRGSLNNMRRYVEFLNEQSKKAKIDLDEIEKFWIAQVEAFFAAKPFKVRLDLSFGIRTIINDIIDQATARQKESTGTYYAGAVMQHLVGAKLACAVGDGAVSHNSFTTADQPKKRSGDFLVGNAAIHVTTTPSEALILKCKDNIGSSLRPIIITGNKGTLVAEALAEQHDVSARIDIFEVSQFIALNIHELGKFIEAGRRTAIVEVIEKYNQIVEEFETDPSLRIENAG